MSSGGSDYLQPGSDVINTPLSSHVDPQSKIVLIAGEDVMTSNATAHLFMEHGSTVVTVRPMAVRTIVNVRSPTESASHTQSGETNQWILEHTNGQTQVGSLEKMYADVIRKVGTPHVVVIHPSTSEKDDHASAAGKSHGIKPVSAMNIDKLAKNMTINVVVASRLAQLAVIGFRKRLSHSASEDCRPALIFTISTNSVHPSTIISNAAVTCLASLCQEESKGDHPTPLFDVELIHVGPQESAEHVAEAIYHHSKPQVTLDRAEQKHAV